MASASQAVEILVLIPFGQILFPASEMHFVNRNWLFKKVFVLFFRKPVLVFRKHFRTFEFAYIVIERRRASQLRIFTYLACAGFHKLPNVDFYSGFVYSMLNLPEALFTPIFAIARITGWSAHRMEELVCGGKIIRPAYECVQPKRNYITLKQR